MKKKIQLSTVRQEADVEVVFVNAAFISKVINADNAIQGIVNGALRYGAITPVNEPEVDENGNEVTDANGCLVFKPVLNSDGNQKVEYNSFNITKEELVDLNETVLPFLTELRKALEGE